MADIISCAQAEKNNKKDEKKYNDIDDGDNRIFLLRAKQYRFRLCRNCGFGKSYKMLSPREPNGPTKAGLAKAIEDGTIYNSTSPYHNVSHEFTYLVAMRDYCNKTLSQMRDNGEVNKKLSKKLKKELKKAKAELASAKFNGLKIESDYYELFLKNINDKFRD